MECIVLVRIVKRRIQLSCVFVVLVDDFRKLSDIRWIAAFYEFNDKCRTDVFVIIIVAVAFTDAMCACTRFVCVKAD